MGAVHEVAFFTVPPQKEQRIFPPNVISSGFHSPAVATALTISGGAIESSSSMLPSYLFFTGLLTLMLALPCFGILILSSWPEPPSLLLLLCKGFPRLPRL